MRFSDYLIALPEADQRALPVDLALGYGRLQLAERLHRESPPAAAMLGLLGAAHAALRAAQATLDPGAPTDDGPAPAAPTDALPPSWDALMGEGQGDIVGALLAMAAEMARDAVAAI